MDLQIVKCYIERDEALNVGRQKAGNQIDGQIDRQWERDREERVNQNQSGGERDRVYVFVPEEG